MAFQRAASLALPAQKHARGGHAHASAIVDAGEAVASVAYRTNEVIAIYPITPSSSMAEWADVWAAEGRRNVWGAVPHVVEMQGEGGAAGALHGALQAGSLGTTFTSSQGLLLMIPTMYKLAGELTPAVFHVAARTLATHALSIFGDHSDVMAARHTGWAMLCSASVQEAMDFALIAQAATLESRVPFVHFFDGFRTSHEIMKIAWLSDDDVRALLDEPRIWQHRARALSPDHPVLRGTAQNPDVFFQSREAANPLYAACPEIVQHAMERFAGRTGRAYQLFEYTGAPDAERVLVLMGSGAETVQETVEALAARGERVGVLKVRLYRPFDVRRFVEALPSTTRVLGVLDRTKEPGGVGEPLYLDCVAALHEGARHGWARFAHQPVVVGGRYGLSSKEFTPAMVAGVFKHVATAHPRHGFTVGIQDDVGHTSVEDDPTIVTEGADRFCAVFYGLGSDGTVGANKNSIKILGEATDCAVQGYFVYDSKKAGAVTVSHLRVSRRPIHSPYLIRQAQFVGCHQPAFLERMDVLSVLAPGGIVLLNSSDSPSSVWRRLPRSVQEQILAKEAQLYVMDAYGIAKTCGLGRRINTIMQVGFFALSGLLPIEQALDAIQRMIRKTYGKKGDEVVRKNLDAVERARDGVRAVPISDQPDSDLPMRPPVSDGAPAFVRDVLGPMIAGAGDALPVSQFPPDGTYPTGTAAWEKRDLALEIPVWEPDACIQCGKCVMACPHAAIRMKVAGPEWLADAPATFVSCPARDAVWAGKRYMLQVAPEDCTGCGICAEVCPAKSKTAPGQQAIALQPQSPRREAERANWSFFLRLPEVDRNAVTVTTVRQQQFQQPLFEFSGACAGCGETPYLKLLSQLFGDRLLIANATGCSSIYGGNLPTTPWTTNAQGRGPAWCNSLFEDNAEFGLGMRLSVDQQRTIAEAALRAMAGQVGEVLAKAILSASQRSEADIAEQRERVAALKAALRRLETPEAKRLLSVADCLVRKSVWIVGGDGWAYDIGFGGLDHVLASGRDVKVLVLDTEVYSNTGGQASKSTPQAALAKFAASGKPVPKKDLGLIAMTYGHVYVASVAMGARDEHTLRAFLEAEAYPGPSLILAYSHCIAHGINMTEGMQHQKAAVDSGQWVLYRYHPERAAKGEAALQIDSLPPRLPLADYFDMEQRFSALAASQPDAATRLHREAQRRIVERRKYYEYLAAWKPVAESDGSASSAVSGQPPASPNGSVGGTRSG
ncbi:MAG: pyruvate:ferredoxin (flavodoxin) oxidoreductase [Candidatus Omnitrophica bacterium]|nr:pyruvate:ferredoxin (flavodoxin) oxidoreductase [Candidatus Omnitrophota bacterium]